MSSLPTTPGAQGAVEEIELIEGTSLWADAWKRLKKNHMAVVCGAFVLFLIAGCFLGPIIINATWGYDFEAQDLEYGAQAPSWAHWFGTDFFGRDLMTRVMYGGQISLIVGLLAASVAAVIGTVYGSVAGYFGGRIDNLMMRVVDVLYALPFTVFAILLMVIFTERSFLLLFAAIGAVEWLTMARIVRGQVMTIKELLYIKAARTLGYSHARIVVGHVLPNVAGPIIVYTTLTVPRVILVESFLSFLGLGIQPPMSSRGLLIRDGASVMESHPWLLIFPGVILSLTLFAMNFLGDGLRDALEPRMQR